jgi:hypothetical protein
LARNEIAEYQLCGIMVVDSIICICKYLLN